MKRVTYPRGVVLPLSRASRSLCGSYAPSPITKLTCNRHFGHTGRHHWYDRFHSGVVGAVWY